MSDNDGAMAAAKGNGDGTSSSVSNKDNNATTTNDDSYEVADMEGSDNSTKAGNEGVTVEGIKNNENYDKVANEEEEEKEELWDLKVILPASTIHDKSKMCRTPGCDLVACFVWSLSLEPETPWYCCLDCQANDFGGCQRRRRSCP